MSNPRTERVISLIASHVDAFHTCVKTNNAEWTIRHREAIERLEKDVLPSGSGIDHGTSVDINASSIDRIVLNTDFHHMDEFGGYAGWTSHRITVRPSFVGILTTTISGRNRNDIKEYLAQTFNYILTSNVEQSWNAETETYSYRRTE